jgi:hypothetical protein
MKVIVLVFFRKREKTDAKKHLSALTSRASELSSMSDAEVTLPFWTWFIENPASEARAR